MIIFKFDKSETKSIIIELKKLLYEKRLWKYCINYERCLLAFL